MIDATTDPNVDRLLRPALTRLRAATKVDATMAGPVTLAGRHLVVTDLHGLLTSTMRGLVVTPGVGIGGKALRMARPVAVNDYLHSPAVSHHFDHKVAQEQIHGAFAVPVRVGREIRAMLYGLARTAQPLGDRVLATAASVAAEVGRELSIEVEVARRLRVVEQERQHRQRRDRATGDFREICEELLSIAQATSDQVLRERLVGVCDRLTPQIYSTAARAPLLTVREQGVLARIAFGHTNQEVAEQLSIMPTTVKTYLKNSMRKLGTRNRVETIYAARCAGFFG